MIKWSDSKTSWGEYAHTISYLSPHLKMSTFGQFFRSLLTNDMSHVGYHQTRSPAADGSANSAPPQDDPDACSSASVDLEDIIEEYDEPSRLSRFTRSGLSLDPTSTDAGGPLTQSYFSLGSNVSIAGCPNGNSGHDEETTSFHSALHDGFSLDEFELRNKYGIQFLWNTTSSKKQNKNNNNSGNNNGGRRDESEPMMQRSDFQVSWHDLTYTIRPRPTLFNVWEDLKDRVTCSLSSAPQRILGNQNPSQSRCQLDGAASKSGDRDGGGGGGGEPITILQHVNGSFESGQLTAVMGPSGAGKTSLINILSRRREEGFTGSVHVNNTDHRVRINAIPQDDHLLECMTVRENLTFASRLKNPNSNHDHAKNVCDVSEQLGLSECLDTRTKNISGGQQKRLAIAQELLSKPDILILDEPTSGLDSLTCLKTLTVMNDLVKASRKKTIEPIAIVLTIHQPQQEAFNLFDKVYVMANGGIVIYDGPPFKCTSFVERHSGLKMPSPDYNPASFLVEIASGEYGQEPIDALAKQVRLEFKMSHSKLFEQRQHSSNKLISEKQNSKRLRHSISLNIEDEKPREVSGATTDDCQTIAPQQAVSGGQGQSQADDKQVVKPRMYLDPNLVKSSSIDSGNFCSKTRTLTARCWKSLWRDPKQVAARVLFHFLLPFGMAFMMGTEPGSANACPRYNSEYALKRIIESDEYISPDRQEEFLLGLENIGVLFMSIYSCISANIAAMTLMFSLDLRSCLKEYYNGWYSMNSFVFARLISNIPLDLILPTITVALTYVVTGQDTGNGQLSDVYRIMITACGIVLASSIGQMMGMMFATIYVGHLATALFASQGATLPFVLLCGFVARTKNMTKFVRAISMSSLMKHGLEITFIARYGWNVCECDPNLVRGNKPVLTGVTDELKNFVKYWMNSQEDVGNDDQTAVSTSKIAPTNTTGEDDDLFQMIAKQLQLYNTYGIEVTSCDQVKPYQLYDFGLTESDLPYSFLALIILFITTLLILLLVIKFLTSYRTSL